jgi:hypothetical protein
LVHLVDGLLNRFLEMPPGIIAISTGYRNHFGDERVTVVAMASLACSLLESSLHKIRHEFADFAGHYSVDRANPIVTRRARLYRILSNPPEIGNPQRSGGTAIRVTRRGEPASSDCSSKRRVKVGGRRMLKPPRDYHGLLALVLHIGCRPKKPKGPIVGVQSREEHDRRALIHVMFVPLPCRIQ